MERKEKGNLSRTDLIPPFIGGHSGLDHIMRLSKGRQR
jgi:hypothetical protein